ncbi:XdhC family protein [Dyella sp.]|uniref:XdhC family protein n=1 Tax=Dyella sp. TaxID=1869338 RepID=UPI002ED2FA77
MNSPQELQTLVAALCDLRRTGFADAAAMATITQTRGSTFRRAGTSMLVHADGRVICELAGGCPQADIVLRAQQVMEQGRTQLVHYNRQDNYDVLIETGCGGELSVLVEPISDEDDLRWLDALAHVLEQRQQGAIATVFADAQGHVLPRPLRMLCDQQGVLFTSIGQPLLALLGEQLDRLHQRVAGCVFPPTQGDAQVLMGRLRPRPALVIIGAHVGARAMADLGHALGWKVSVVDADAGRLSMLPEHVERVVAGPASVREQLHLDEFTALVAMTHRLELDLEYLQALGEAPLSYVGAIGSRERAQRMAHALDGSIDPLYMPAGLDIGSDTPQEIALAVTAEILATFNAREGRRLSLTAGSIHS